MPSFLRAMLAFLCLLQASALLAPALLANAASGPSVQAIEKALRDNYVFPSRVPDIVQSVSDAMAGPGWSDMTDAQRANRLTDALVDATGDHHFVVGVQEETGPSPVEFSSLEDPASNYGFNDARLLDGNIGYVRFDNFSEPDAAFATASAALKFVENAEGLIIDLRYNNGGYNALGQFIASHLFTNEEDRLITSYYYNEGGKRIESGHWVLAGVPGRRRPDMPVHVLTSSVTFSAAEWLAHSLQKMERAKVVGTQTAGGGHAIERFPLEDSWFIQVPIGEIRGPTGEEFEGVGVTPDLAVPSRHALKISHLAMLEELNALEPSARRDWVLAGLRPAIAPPELSQAWLADVAGQYEGRELIHEDEGLTYKWAGRFVLGLRPLSQRLFAVEGTEDFRLEIVGDTRSDFALARIFADGTRQVFKRVDASDESN